MTLVEGRQKSELVGGAGRLEPSGITVDEVHSEREVHPTARLRRAGCDRGLSGESFEFAGAVP